MKRAVKAAVMRQAMDVAGTVMRIWGSGPIGTALTYAYYTDDPWRTVDAIAETTHLSSAAVRRRLDELATLGRVETTWRGRSKVYRAARKQAEATVNALVELSGGVALCNERFSQG